jgi:hypothetical protein
MVSIGIDISKEKSTVCMLRPYGEVVEPPYDVAHNESELNALIEHIQSFDEDVKVVLEATGGYHHVVVSKLISVGIFTVVVNPYIMKKYCAATLRKAKTDKIDSVKIAHYGIDHWFSMTAYCPPDEVYAELKLLGRQYEQYVRLKVGCKIHLADLLDGVMPGIKKILTGNVPAFSTKDKLCDFVEKYWHYDNIKKLSEKQFLASYEKWSKKKGYRYNESQAIAIYQLSKNNIPTLKSSTPSTKMLVLQAVKSVRDAELTLSLIISQMQEIASTLPEYSVVNEMKGVGAVLSVRLIAEIGDEPVADARVHRGGDELPVVDRLGRVLGAVHKLPNDEAVLVADQGVHVVVGVLPADLLEHGHEPEDHQPLPFIDIPRRPPMADDLLRVVDQGGQLVQIRFRQGGAVDRVDFVADGAGGGAQQVDKGLVLPVQVAEVVFRPLGQL